MRGPGEWKIDRAAVRRLKERGFDPYDPRFELLVYPKRARCRGPSMLEWRVFDWRRVLLNRRCRRKVVLRDAVGSWFCAGHAKLARFPLDPRAEALEWRPPPHSGGYAWGSYSYAVDELVGQWEAQRILGVDADELFEMISSYQLRAVAGGYWTHDYDRAPLRFCRVDVERLLEKRVLDAARRLDAGVG